MKIQRLLAASVLVGGLAAVPAWAEDITLEFTVWNYSLDTIEDNATQVRGRESRHQGQDHRLYLAGLPRQPGIALQRRHANRHRLCRPGLAARLGRRRLLRAARRHRAGRCARRSQVGHGAVLDYRHDLQGQALRPALLRRHDFVHLQQEDAGGRRHRGAEDLGRGDGGRRKAQGRRHGASDRLRVRPGAAELLRRLRLAGLWPWRRSLRQGPEGDLRQPRQRCLQAA